MKNIIIKSIIIIFVLSVSSCNKDYLDTTPTESVSESSVFATVKDARAAINGIHRFMFYRLDAQDEAGFGAMMINYDMMGEDLVMTSSGNGWFNSVYKWIESRSETSSLVDFTYEFYYKIISNSNMIINNIDNATGDESEKNSIKGQALAYRAWAHFMLVQSFGQRYDASGSNSGLGVPILIDNTVEGQPRSTVEQVYTQVIADLNASRDLLSTADERLNISHINIDVVKGLIARVALTMQNYSLAAQMSSEARAGYSLMDEEEYYSGFNNIDNPEWIWGGIQISDHNTFFASFFAYMSYNFSSTNIRSNPKAINSLLYDEISDTDYRKGLWDPEGIGFDQSTSFTTKPYMNRKFMAAGGSSSIGDLMYMRASEMILIEAESKARMGDDAGAAEALFELASARDTAYLLSSNTGQALLDEISIQRRVELWGEGFRFFDLKRNNEALDRNGANHDNTLVAGKFDVAAGDREWQWLFPRRELNANDKIEQNP
ncbi:RagB/SusD family nutrient uptake outer membrane protein [Membranihabitans marinus]|uniref:RagB/SusD family nutrient uptake outer membrane protein n=1 Tax=Membranihabitans marinus TaxID=1227546 RepID=UPI001F386BD7|nr:RagB/SusD family nutrient uptake outer membrane protein [Membranihabitans marinus]